MPFIHKEIETEFFKTNVLEEGILENFIKEGVHFDAKKAWELKKANLELANGEKYVVLLQAGYLADITKDAREAVSSSEYLMSTKAKALLVTSMGQKIMGNFYLSINKPVMKTAVFSEREKAIEWLRKQL
ncbi:MAG: hypothetical protein IPM51_11245 [Sphingobacteriaceae bacterium]|nr:hypothetical protein [Sphingobacteriaceae bacterium]